MENHLLENQVKEREVWIDCIKVFACILVVLGHFFQSMVSSQIIADTTVYQWFNKTIYYFHVQLFFISSGYLFQKYSKINSFESWKHHIVKKAIALGVPYIIFSTLTWILKAFFAGSINHQMSGGLLYTLLVLPASPYWYLYCLFIIFVITPTFKDKKAAGIGLGLAILALVILHMGLSPDIYVLTTVLSNEIWFVIGMCLAIINYEHMISKINKWLSLILGGVFLLLSIIVYYFNIVHFGIQIFLGILASVAVMEAAKMISWKAKWNIMIKYLAQYTMPIFLMHTLWAAPVRIILMKINIEHPVIHIVVGIGISFIGPIVCAIILKWLPRMLCQITGKHND